MNCINHPDVPVAAYCQSCGKALCQECVRSIGGVMYCEPCLAARLNNPAAHPSAGMPQTPGAAAFVGLPPLEGPNPGLALGLGFIPGVGAMYNGQFVKGFAHVLVFALLCTIAGSHTPFDSIFGLLIPFWIAYQVFDSYQTAKARRDGTPLPNPFGLNDLGHKLGLQQHPEGTVPPFGGGPNAGFRPGWQAAPQAGSQSGAQSGTEAGTTSTFTSTPYTTGPYAGAPGSEKTGYTPVGGPQDPYAPPVSGFVPPAGAPGVPFAPSQGTFGSSGIPVGAVVLIGLGVLFLLSSLGIFRDEWLARSWPLVLIGIGAWLVYRRTREAQGGKGL